MTEVKEAPLLPQFGAHGDTVLLNKAPLLSSSLCLPLRLCLGLAIGVVSGGLRTGPAAVGGSCDCQVLSSMGQGSLESLPT